ncbi:hypothetical protein GLYMA_13G135150v4 [Glycine max]|nr:hypothetical protein GLYMA_13G135150v4 [Glycine max]KAH1101349.1 hypothetical protein GYH30_036098 [Glycine max]
MKSIAILLVLLTYHISIRVLHCLYIENLTCCTFYLSIHSFGHTIIPFALYHRSPSLNSKTSNNQNKTNQAPRHLLITKKKLKKSQGQDCGPHYPSSNRLRSNYSKKQNK